jgi:hypothetical protein
MSKVFTTRCLVNQAPSKPLSHLITLRTDAHFSDNKVSRIFSVCNGWLMKTDNLFPTGCTPYATTRFYSLSPRLSALMWEVHVPLAQRLRIWHESWAELTCWLFHQKELRPTVYKTSRPFTTCWSEDDSFYLLPCFWDIKNNHCLLSNGDK